MITVKLKGGLGNQMFQYACGRSISIKTQQPLQLDVSFFTNRTSSTLDTPRKYALSVFNIEASVGSEGVVLVPKTQNTLLKKILSKVTTLFQKNSTEPTIREILKKEKTFLDGYWQSEAYFNDIREVIVKDFTLKNELGIEALLIKRSITESPVSVSIHIRRGDYVANKNANAHHGTCTLGYYTEAIKLITNTYPEAVFFIFSDDIPWVKENLSTPNTKHFVSNQTTIKDEEEILLMSICNHHIIANSSFSWWGAWLGEQKDNITIAPKQWFANSKTPDNLIPQKWIQL